MMLWGRLLGDSLDPSHSGRSRGCSSAGVSRRLFLGPDALVAGWEAGGLTG